MIFDLDTYDHPPARLTGPEKRWLEQQRTAAELAAAENDRRRLVGPGRKLNGAIDRWKTTSRQLATALANASVTSPPQPAPAAGRRGTDVSDPTLAQIESTWNSVDAACVTWAHLIGPCRLDDCRVCDRQIDTLTSLYDRLGIDLQAAVVIDALLGTPATSRQSFLDVLTLTEAWSLRWADDLRTVWHDMRRGGLDDDVLTQVADRLSDLSGRARGLVGSVTQWLPTSIERRCANDSCGGAAPPMGKGATCQKCRKSRSREAAS